MSQNVLSPISNSNRTVAVGNKLWLGIESTFIPVLVTGVWESQISVEILKRAEELAQYFDNSDFDWDGNVISDDGPLQVLVDRELLYYTEGTNDA